MQDLFSHQDAALSPLADRMRPRTLDEFIGQSHIVGPGRLLRRAIEADRMTSSIFYGPPGCGKTTLASIIAGTTHSAFVQLNAVTSGVADVRKVLSSLKVGDSVTAVFYRPNRYNYLKVTVNLTVHEYVPEGLSAPESSGDIEFN